MDLEQRPHFRASSTGHNTTTTTTTNELFICFASRLSSSSSMKLTKSILSPARAASSRDGAGQPSLSSSLSRRLRASGSLKGGASPFLTTAGKRRNVGFENPEPSSPKVTCIGQVRVKTKKKVKQTRSLSKRRSGEISFRKIESAAADSNNNNNNNGGDSNKIRYSNAGGAHYQPAQQQECLPHRNQKWVHLPISICEALRDFSCLFPCKSSCFSRDKVEEEGRRSGSDENGCGAVFARWLVSVNDGEGGRRREIELVVGGGDEEEEEEARPVSMRSSRRHVFDDIEVRDDRIEIKGQGSEGEVEKARVSICIPPKNALLLMRCRSDPMKMASLATKFSWDAQGVCENVCESVGEEKTNEPFEECVVDDAMVEEHEVSNEDNIELTEIGEVGEAEEEFVVLGEEEMDQDKETEDLEKEIARDEEKLIEEEEEVESNMSSFETLLNQENTAGNYDDNTIQDEDEEIKGGSPLTERDNVESNETTSPVVEEVEALPLEKENEEEAESSTVAEKDPIFTDDDDAEINPVKPDPETTELMEKSEAEECFEEPKKERERQMLPECLLLMMCEPKLSMEVSKETWVCSTDFIRCLPERPRKAEAKAAKVAGDQETAKRRLSIDSKPRNNLPPLSRNRNEQPPRSSCSLPAAASMAAVIEQKLVNAVGYEPFVLTRCKSEPMRTAAVKLMPESCLVWNNAKMGIGAAGVGF